MDTYNARPRVAKGATALDLCKPGWAAKINRESLDASSKENSIPTHVWGVFEDMPIELQNQAVELGFLAKSGSPDECHALVLAFHEEIDKRLAKPQRYAA